MAWAKYALSKGHRIWYESEAVIIHVHEETISQTMNRYRREGLAHKEIFGHQKMGFFEALFLFFANTLRDYVAAIPRRRLFNNFLASLNSVTPNFVELGWVYVNMSIQRVNLSEGFIIQGIHIKSETHEFN